MKQNSIDTVELLAFTHLHNDHTNGVKTLTRNVYVENVIYPPFEYDSVEIMSTITEQKSQPIEQSDTITVLDNVTVEIIADAINEPSAADANERCICYRITYGDIDLLITGDLAGSAEMNLLKNELSGTILKVGHHGSDSSSFYPFLKKIAPEIAIISVGDNSYGLPKEEVIDRLNTICPIVLTTVDEGTICYRTDGTFLERISE
jgi:competence protein ComEC